MFVKKFIYVKGVNRCKTVSCSNYFLSRIPIHIWYINSTEFSDYLPVQSETDINNILYVSYLPVKHQYEKSDRNTDFTATIQSEERSSVQWNISEALVFFSPSVRGIFQWMLSRERSALRTVYAFCNRVAPFEREQVQIHINMVFVIHNHFI